MVTFCLIFVAVIPSICVGVTVLLMSMEFWLKIHNRTMGKKPVWKERETPVKHSVSYSRQTHNVNDEEAPSPRQTPQPQKTKTQQQQKCASKAQSQSTDNDTALEELLSRQEESFSSGEFGDVDDEDVEYDI